MARTEPGAPARWRSRQPGFTLLELLVVIAIIGIVISIATLSIGVLGEDRELESESRRLTDVVALALEQAQLEGRDFGLRLEDAGYEVQSFDGRAQRWLTVDDDPWFRTHELPAGVALALTLEGRRILLGRQDDDKLEEPLPQIILYASGDATPYEIRLSRAGATGWIALAGAADGTIELTRPATEP